MLVGVLDKTPECVTLLNGPSNCGKSALLLEIVTRRNLDSTLSGNKQDFLVLDLRNFYTTNPAAFASLLGRELAVTPWWRDMMNTVGAAKVNTPAGIMVLNLKAKDDPAQMALGRLQQVLEVWINDAKGNRRPVIIIDEANRLCDWKDKDATSLQGLLDMFVAISKQAGKCHVILATSDDFMASWLQKQGLRPNQFKPMTLGNFTEEDAKTFVCGSPKLWDDDPPDALKPPPSGGTECCWPGLLRQFGAARPADVYLPDQVWPQLYSVCGGNAKALRITVADAATFFTAGTVGTVEECWNEAFEIARMLATAHVATGFTPENQPARGGKVAAWSRGQWAVTLQEIAEAKYHAVPEARLKAALGGGTAGEAALMSLVRFNMVSFRQRSSLAFDLPLEVYGVKGQRPKAVITAPYPAFLECILDGQWKEEPPTADAVAVTSKGSGGQEAAVEPQLGNTAAAIRDVEAEIKNVEGTVKELQLSKPEGWQQEVAYLRNEKAQLREKELLLLREKAQLREKELLLLRSRQQL